MQYIQANVRAMAVSAGLHRGLVASTPGIGKAQGIKASQAVAFKEDGRIPRNTGPPVHHGAEDVETEGFYLAHVSLPLQVRATGGPLPGFTRLRLRWQEAGAHQSSRLRMVLPRWPKSKWGRLGPSLSITRETAAGTSAASRKDSSRYSGLAPGAGKRDIPANRPQTVLIMAAGP